MTTYSGDRRLARHYIRAGDFERAAYFDPAMVARHLARLAVGRAHDSKPSPSKRDTMSSNNTRRVVAMVKEAVRYAADSAARRQTSRKSAMPRQSRGLSAAAENQLFQRRPGDPGYRYESAAELALDSRRRARDEDDPAEVARENLAKAMIHLEAVKSGESEFDPERLHGYVDGALRALGPSAGQDDEDDEERFGPQLDEDRDEVVNPGGEGGPSSIRSRDGISAPPMALRRRAPARDGVGEVPARSVVTTRGERSERDHRADFQPATDHALDGDMDALFQKAPR